MCHVIFHSLIMRLYYVHKSDISLIYGIWFSERFNDEWFIFFPYIFYELCWMSLFRRSLKRICTMTFFAIWCSLFWFFIHFRSISLFVLRNFRFSATLHLLENIHLLWRKFTFLWENSHLVERSRFITNHIPRNLRLSTTHDLKKNRFCSQSLWKDNINDSNAYN